MSKEENTKIYTKEEFKKVTDVRVDEIAKEFEVGFKFIGDYPRSVTFFGSSLMDRENPYCLSAKALAGKIVKELGYSVFTGGGPGIMEAANRGAYENGGSSLALTIRLPHPQIVNDYITKQVDPNYFFVRKVLLSFSASAFIFYPGGFGTLDEFFEIITLIQTQKITDVPLICVGSDYWLALKSFMEKELLSRGTIAKENIDLFTITDDQDKIIDIIRKTPLRKNLDIHSTENTM